MKRTAAASRGASVGPDTPSVACAVTAARRGARNSGMRTQSGFTITELMITIAVAAVLAGLAAPSFRGMFQNNRLATQTNTLITHRSLARSEAIKRNLDVVVCRSANPTAAPPTCGGTAQDWSTGWITFADVNRNGTFDNGTDVLLKVSEGVTGDITLNTNGTTDANIIYVADGTARVPPAPNDGQFVVCDSRGADFGRQVNVGPLGRPALTHGTPDDPLGTCSP